MGCATQNQQPTILNVSMGALPEGFCGTPQELANAIAQRLIIQFSQNAGSFVSGDQAPTSNVGPWFKNCSEWFVWDDALGMYVPISNRGTFSNSQKFAASGTFTVPDFIYKIKARAWGGGGGGEYSGGITADAGGGGGGYGEAVFNVTPGQVVNVTVGVGGAVGNPGTDGGDTTVLTMTAHGGKGGTLSVPSLGGQVNGADFGIDGGISGYPVLGQPSQGGFGPQGGSGGAFSAAGGAVLNGIIPGGGGAGGYSTFTGGNGAAGAVLIEW